MFPEPTQLLLIGCLIESILDPIIQIKYIDTKNQLADILTKENFTRCEWNHLVCLFNISHCLSTVCSDTMSKRSQQDSGEERVTAKSRPMMNLIARTPSFVSSSTSVSPGKKYYGNIDPWKSVAGEDRSGDLVKARIYLKPLIIASMSNSWKLLFIKLFKIGIRSIRGTWWNFLENGTKSSTWSRGISSRRNRAIRKERRNTSW